MTFQLAYSLTGQDSWSYITGLASSPYTISPLVNGELYDVTVEVEGSPGTVSAIAMAQPTAPVWAEGVSDLGGAAQHSIGGLWSPAPYYQRSKNQTMLQMTGGSAPTNYTKVVMSLPVNGGTKLRTWTWTAIRTQAANFGLMVYLPPQFTATFLIYTSASAYVQVNVPAFS